MIHLAGFDSICFSVKVGWNGMLLSMSILFLLTWIITTATRMTIAKIHLLEFILLSISSQCYPTRFAPDHQLRKIWRVIRRSSPCYWDSNILDSIIGRQLSRVTHSDRSISLLKTQTESEWVIGENDSSGSLQFSVYIIFLLSSSIEMSDIFVER